MTTNGIGLARRAEALKQARLNRVNVSLDTVDAACFARITRRDRLHDVQAGLAAAQQAGLTPVKANAVLDPVTGLDDAVSLLRFCLTPPHAPPGPPTHPPSAHPPAPEGSPKFSQLAGAAVWSTVVR